MPKTKLLLIEDRAPIAQIIRTAVGESCEVMTADRSTAVPESLQAHAPSVVVLNLDRTTQADQDEALRLLQEIRQLDETVKTVVCVGPSDRQVAASAARTGAFDVIMKPFDPELLRAVLRRALWMSGLEQESAQAAVAPMCEDIPGMVGASQNINKIFDAIRKVSSSDVPSADQWRERNREGTHGSCDSCP
ncbi:MAG: response regulator [Nitrospiraceae bacterium]